MSLLKQMVRDDPTLVDPKLSVMWQMIAAKQGKRISKFGETCSDIPTSKSHV